MIFIKMVVRIVFFIGFLPLTFATIRYELVGQNKTPNKTAYSVTNVKFERQCFSKCHHDEECLSFLTVETTSKIYQIDCHFYNTVTTSLTHSQTYQKTKLYTDIQDCSDLYQLGHTGSGVYSLNLPAGLGLRDVRCNMEVRGGGWMVFTYRMSGQHAWNVDWETYKNGFGNHPGDFYMGNEMIHRITTSGDYEFYYTTEQLGTGTKYYGWYETFYIESESDFYRLRLEGASEGTVNRLTVNRNHAFSSDDQDNDTKGQHCARDLRKGGFWYAACGQFNPHGIWHDPNEFYCMGIETNAPNVCTKNFQMMFRRKHS